MKGSRTIAGAAVLWLGCFAKSFGFSLEARFSNRVSNSAAVFGGTSWAKAKPTEILDDKDLSILFDEDVDETKITPNNHKTNSTNKKKEVTAASTKATTKTYDMNALKRNRVQETVAEYKHELFEVECPPEEFGEKLRDLLQINPVSTTTDSNLLEGLWSLAYVFGDSPKKNKNKKISRRVCLEELSDDEAPHVVDYRNIMGQFLGIEETYTVQELTRRSLCLVGMHSRIFFGRISLWKRRLHKETEMQVLYLDVDLCICRSNSNADDNALTVYTKNESWMPNAHGIQRNKTKKRFWNRSKTVEVASTVVPSTTASVHIGELEMPRNGWTVDEDPYACLPHQERLALLKKLSIGDITNAHRERMAQRRHKRRKKLVRPSE